MAKATATATAKAKTKGKAKLKSRSKLSARPKKKTTKIKSQPKATKKTKAKTKPASKKNKIISKRKPKSKKFEIKFSNQQKAGLLTTITKIIDLHRADKDGLKSLTQIDRIIDKFNQHYTTPNEKFDAIVKYGMQEDSPELNKKFYHLPKDQETATLYQLLSTVGNGKTKYPAFKDKIHQLYKDALKSRE